MRYFLKVRSSDGRMDSGEVEAVSAEEIVTIFEKNNCTILELKLAEDTANYRGEYVGNSVDLEVYKKYVQPRDTSLGAEIVHLMRMSVGETVDYLDVRSDRERLELLYACSTLDLHMIYSRLWGGYPKRTMSRADIIAGIQWFFELYSSTKADFEAKYLCPFSCLLRG